MLRTILLLVACLVAFSYAQDLPEQSFTVDFTGTFVHGAIGDLPGCDYCDCKGANQCKWENNIVCPSRASAGADDNQQEWGTCSSNCNCGFSNSRVGFQGTNDVTMLANAPNSTRIGKITHYNNPITGVTPTALRLTMTLSIDGLSDKFYIAYPLGFIETPNCPAICGGNCNANGCPASSCDSAVQRSNVPCDDRFSFNDIVLTDSFEFNNIRYTLDITGFIQASDPLPIRQFSTVESAVSVADVYGRIITFCITGGCGINELFYGPPLCQCQCQLSNATCQGLFNSDWIVGDLPEGGPGCTCVCIKDPATCNASDPSQNFNQDHCDCGCNLNDTYCRSVNPLWDVTANRSKCECECSRQKYIECAALNAYLRPVGDDCACVCFLTEEICHDLFNDQYTVDTDRCGCVVPPVEGDGLTDEEIAGIVIATVLGPLLLIALVAALAAVLIYLIQAGIIPGIYGYKIAAADVTMAADSGIYDSPWQGGSNAMG